MTVQLRLNQHLMKWDEIINAFRNAVHNQAVSEARYKHDRAVFIAEQRAADPKLSQSAAETLADADPVLNDARIARLGSDAEVEAFKQKLIWCRSQADALRSEVASERANAALYADHPGAA